MNSFDLIPTVERILREHGLVFENVDISGKLTNCGTTKAPNGTDGRYKVHLDFPPNVWLLNHHEMDEGITIPLWEKEELDAMTPEQREALRERIRQDRERAAQQAEKRRVTAAELAKNLFRTLAHADVKTPYLSRKGVDPLGDMRKADAAGLPVQGLSGEVLVLPVRNADGAITSLQFIDGEGCKRFLSGGEKRGCFFPIPANDKGHDGPLLIGEGVATVLSACMATGYAGLVAFDAGNLLPAGETAHRLNSGRRLCFIADNDCSDHDGAPVPDEKNTGYQAAYNAARAVGGVVAMCPALDGKRADFNDLHVAQGLDAVKDCIAKVLAEDNPIRPPFYVVPKGVRAGLYKSEKKGEDVAEYRLAPPLRVLGRTRNEHSKDWGVLLEWNDPAGVRHRLALPDELTQRQGRDWAALLAAEGYSIEPNMHGRFLGFLSSLKTSRFITNTSRVGWYDHCFVLPDVSIGAEDGLVVLQSLDCMGDLYQCAGTLEGWQSMAALCAGNTRFIFALCASFAGTLLRPSSMEGGGFSFEGASSCGKTTCLQLAASVWGSESHVRTWRTTSNGLESVAALHNDGLLVLDEIGQATGRDLAEVSYMLANGSGKTRAGRTGSARQRASWRLLFLSSGELGLADKLGEDGLKSRAGQEVRFAGIPVDKADIAELHGMKDAGTLVNAIKSGTARHYGYASRAFLRWLVAHYDEVQNALAEALAGVVGALCPDGSGEQVRRVARRFAIVHVAGKLAQKAGVLPPALDVAGAVRACFSAWLDNRGSLGASEDEAILAQVRLFIEQNGASRFQDVNQPDGLCINRAGFRQLNGDSTDYFILPESFRKEVVKGFDYRRAARVLAAAGWLHMEKGLRSRISVKGMGRIYCYQINLTEND